MFIGVALAGATGACLRFLVDRLIRRSVSRGFPFGTVIINLSGSLALGFIVGLGVNHTISDPVVVILGTGFCGAFTTFSTFSFDVVRMLEDRAFRSAAVCSAVSVVGGLIAAGVGLVLAATI